MKPLKKPWRNANMKRLDSIETDKVQLEVVECDCGYHMGIDATYLDQKGDFVTRCPSCNRAIVTSEICPNLILDKSTVS